MEFGPDGNLYVASSLADKVIRYDRTTGDLMDVFVPTGSAGLGNPRGMEQALRFRPSGSPFFSLLFAWLIRACSASVWHPLASYSDRAWSSRSERVASY